MPEDEIKNKGLDVLLKFIEEAFFSGTPSLKKVRLGPTKVKQTKKSTKKVGQRKKNTEDKHKERMKKGRKKNKTKKKKILKHHTHHQDVIKRKGAGLKILTPKKLVPRLLTLLAQKDW